MTKLCRIAAIAVVSMMVPPMSGCLFAQLAGHSGTSGSSGAGNGGHITLQSITVSPINGSSNSQMVGNTIGFKAVGTLSNSTQINLTQYVSWSSASSDIAQALGLVGTGDSRNESFKCNSVGSVEIRAIYGLSRGVAKLLCTTPPPPASLVSISISPTSVSQNVGQVTQLRAIGIYSDNTTKDITTGSGVVWAIVDQTVATLGTATSTQPLNCIHGGSTTASATLGLISNSITVACAATLSLIAINPSTASVNVGNPFGFFATGTYSDGSTKDVSTAGTWSSSNTTVASLGSFTSGQQQFNCLTAGSVSAILTIGTTVGTATLTCTTPPPPQPTVVSVSVSPVSPNVTVGSTIPFVAVATYSDGTQKDVTLDSGTVWNSSATSVATLSAGTTQEIGNCVTAGTSTVKATFQTVFGSQTLTCSAPVPTLSTIALSPALPNTYFGSNVPMVATGTYSDGTKQNVSAQATWASTSTSVATVAAPTASSDIATCAGTAGTSTISATIGAVSGSTVMSCSPVPVGTNGNAYCTPSSTWVGATTDGPAALPNQCMYTPLSATPSPGTLHTLTCSLSALQTAVNAGACGDKYTLPAGCDLGVGTLNLPHKGCDSAHWNLVESLGVSDPNFPAEGNRATPCIFNVQTMPNRNYPCPTARNLGVTISAGNASNAIRVNGGDEWRLVGFKVTRVATPGVSISNLVDLSSVGTQTTNFICDRCWFAGIEPVLPIASPSTDTSTTRAVNLAQANRVAIIDSYFTNFYDTGFSANGNTDAQCVGGGFGSTTNSGWGIYKFVNNHCEASGEGILLGGSGGPALTPGGCTITVNCNLDVPTDIEARRNYFFKPPQWSCASPPCSSGYPVIKNGFEMKIGARALFEGNVVENVWYGAQVGWCWTLAPKNQSNGTGTLPTAPTALTNDFTYRYNYCRNAATGTGYYASQDANCPTCASQGMNGISDHDNVFDAMIPASCCKGDAFIMTAVSDPSGRGLNRLQNVSIRHNTYSRADRFALLIGANSTGQMFNFTFQDNVIANAFGVGSNPSLAGCSTQNSLNFILSNCYTGSTVNHNAVFNWPTGTTLGANWPTGNFFFNGTSGVGFTSYGTGDANYTLGNYQLTTGSSLHNAGSDGKDIGADTQTVLQKISNVAF